jgi:small subunit ribosomal protein S2
MADPTAEVPASPEAGDAPPTSATESETAAALETAKPTVRELLEAGVHFGHQTRRWNPRMKPFLFGERNGIHIVDLDQTLPRFVKALEFLREKIASGGRILFIGTKRQAQALIQLEAERSGQFYVNNRWLGGMLTNFKTVKKSIERFKEMLELAADEEKVGELSKKDRARLNRNIEKYRKCLDGMKEMTKLPDAVFIIDVNREEIAVREARRLGIPIVAVVDSNGDPYDIDYVVPGNDDAVRAIQLYCSRVADACLEGAAIFNDRVQAEVAEEEKVRGAAAPPAPSPTGKVVVEIKHPPRRGRAHGVDRRAAAEAAEASAGTGAPEAPAAASPAEAPTAVDAPASPEAPTPAEAPAAPAEAAVPAEPDAPKTAATAAPAEAPAVAPDSGGESAAPEDPESSPSS